MRAALAALVTGNLAVAAAVAATSGTRVGSERWHDDAAYALLAVLALAAIPLLRRRRVTTLLLASAGGWSALTGFLLVYVKPTLAHGRWLDWWHGVASVGFLLAFLAHWARNRARLAGLLGKLAARPRWLAALALAWAAVGAAAVATWATPSRAALSAFSDRYLDHLTTLAVLWTGAVVVCGAAVATSPRVRARLEPPDARNRLRGAVDASLWTAMWAATLTGFPLLYFSGGLRALGGYWLMAAWHVVASVALLGLVAWHVGFNARPLRAHVR